MKYSHTAETQATLDDLENRVQQFIEANELYQDTDNDDTIEAQNRAFKSVLTLIKQLRKTGHIYRGNHVMPDDLEPIVATKWIKQSQLV